VLKPYHQAKLLEAGCDEAGRGCLAGPVVAAAVILPKRFRHPLLNDSKQLSEKQRMELRPIIMEKALAWGIASCSPAEIDDINILKASFLAMHRAVDKLSKKPELLLIDGNRFTPFPNIPHYCQVKGDATYLHIAAASILAKTERDLLMEDLHKKHPEYDWKSNKGYPTKKHRDAIRMFGTTEYHRMSFQLLPRQMSLDFEN
jgi:ribonuclease HII